MCTEIFDPEFKSTKLNGDIFCSIVNNIIIVKLKPECTIDKGDIVLIN